MNICIKCNEEYDRDARRGKPGKITECDSCAEETVEKYTGNIIYDHKTGASLQINTDPKLTQYIMQATKLQCKGSNLGNNLKVNSAYAKVSGACKKTVGEKLNAKGRL